MSRPVSTVVLIGVLITAAPRFPPVSAQPQTDTSADARLRVLYTEEWSWRQQELARGDQGLRRAIVAKELVEAGASVVYFLAMTKTRTRS